MKTSMNTRIASSFLALALLGLPHSASCASPEEILKMCRDKYASMDSIAASGRVINDITSPNLPAPPKTGELKYDLGNPGRISTFNLRLSKPNLYRVAWEQPITASFVNKGAAWSDGDGDFMNSAGMKTTKMESMEMALAAATGVSGGAANTLPSMFFGQKTDILKSMKDLKSLPDETVEGESCHAISGSSPGGQKITVWISSESLLKKKQVMLGGEIKIPEISDEDMAKTLKAMGKDASPEAIKQMKETMKMVQAQSKQLSGSITEIYEKTEVNPKLAKSEFTEKPDAAK